MIKIFYFITFLFFISACNGGSYSVKGSVKSIEWGKDGYTALIKTPEGNKVSATISRINMGIRYKELKAGDIVKIYGDSSNFENEISVIATKIVD
jgi:molybdopterin-binding protein